MYYIAPSQLKPILYFSRSNMGLHLYESWHLPCVLLATTMIGYKMDTGGGKSRLPHLLGNRTNSLCVNYNIEHNIAIHCSFNKLISDCPCTIKLWCSSIYPTFSYYVADLQDYCEKDTFNAKCPDGEVVLIEEARYGRMALGTCIKHDYGTLNCFRFVMIYLSAIHGNLAWTNFAKMYD